MKPEELARAVERLSGFNVYARDNIHCALNIPLDKPLAALIEAAAKPYSDDQRNYCRACNGTPPTDSYEDLRIRHKADCALVALVRSINGEGER